MNINATYIIDFYHEPNRNPSSLQAQVPSSGDDIVAALHKLTSRCACPGFLQHWQGHYCYQEQCSHCQESQYQHHSYNQQDAPRSGSHSHLTPWLPYNIRGHKHRTLQQPIIPSPPRPTTPPVLTTNEVPTAPVVQQPSSATTALRPQITSR